MFLLNAWEANSCLLIYFIYDLFNDLAYSYGQLFNATDLNDYFPKIQEIKEDF